MVDVNSLVLQSIFIAFNVRFYFSAFRFDAWAVAESVEAWDVECNENEGNVRVFLKIQRFIYLEVELIEIAFELHGTVVADLYGCDAYFLFFSIFFSKFSLLFYYGMLFIVNITQNKII